MDWNERVCFLESVKAKIRERRNKLKELQEERGGLRKRKVGRETCVGVNKLEHDKGENDRLENGSEGSNSDDEDYMGEDSDSDDEDYSSSDNDLSVDEEDDDSEDWDEDFFDTLGLNDISEPIEEDRVQKDRPFLMLGITFKDKAELKGAINNYAIKNGVKLKFEKSDKMRVRVKCQKGCPFVLYATKEGLREGLVVKTLHVEHKCSRVFKNPRASFKWVATHFRKKVQERPQYKIF